MINTPFNKIFYSKFFILLTLFLSCFVLLINSINAVAATTQNSKDSSATTAPKNSSQQKPNHNGTLPYLKPFTAKYSILHKSKKVGEGTRKLTYLDDDTIEYSYKSDISWLIFSDTRSEISTLKYHDDVLTPLKYEYIREGTGRDKHYLWTFDAANNSASNIKKKKTVNVDFSQPLQDTLSYHLQHRLKMIEHPNQKQFVYPVIKTSGKVKNYVYQYDGEEELMLPYGLIKTIRLKRELIEKKRITYAWFAPELDYLLVKLYQVKGGTEQFEAQLTSLKITD